MIRTNTMQNRTSQHYNLIFEPYVLDNGFPLQYGGSIQITDETSTYLHRHNCLEIGYCHEGHGVFVIDNEVLPYKQGDLSIVNNMQFHIARSAYGTDSEWTFILLDPISFLDNNSQWALTLINSSITLPGIIEGDRYPETSRLVSDILNELEKKDRHYKDVIRGLLLALFAKAERLSSTNTIQSNLSKLDIIAPALKYISENYNDTISIPQLAGICCISDVHLRRLFKEITGQSPQEYITDIRMKMAAVMLSNSTTSVASIATEVGFNTISCFNRQFKHCYSISPSEWRLQGGTRNI
ncbi:MAG: AraC family transcriptional regulator [Armatimonadota bacterium]